MKVLIVAVGKPRNAAIAAAIEEYERRAAHYWPLEVHEVREEPAKSVSADRVREREGSRLSDVVPAAAHLVACDPGGASKTSEEFSAWLQGERERGHDVAFVIGGAFGLSPRLSILKTTRIRP